MKEVVKLVTAEELAKLLRFERANGSFYAFLRSLGITPVPHRRGVFDPVFVRRRLDELQGLLPPGVSEPAGLTDGKRALLARRSRRGEAD